MDLTVLTRYSLESLDTTMSVIQFSVRLGLYDEAYTDTKEYGRLSINYPGSLTP